MPCIQTIEGGHFMIKRRNAWIANYAGMLSLLCMFIVGSLALTSVGVYVYKNIVENNAQNYQLRVSLSYVATKVHQYDTSGQISVEEENGIPILVLRESLDSGNYRTMIYCYKGKMRELFQEEGLSYSLEDGMEVMELDQLKLKQDGKQIFVKAIENGEQEQLVLNIRSEYAACSLQLNVTHL